MKRLCESEDLRKLRPSATMLALLVLLQFLPACTRTPDLTLNPIESSLCEASGERRVAVAVLNTGKGPAKATTTELSFSGAAPVRLPTRPIEAGGVASVSYRVPDRCVPTSCSVTVTVDAKDEVRETDETNNSAERNCGGGG